MSHPFEFRGCRVLVVGLGRFGGGVGVTRWFASGGANVTVTDLAQHDELSTSISQLDGLDIAFRLGGHDDVDPGCFDLVVVNPAVDKKKSEYFQKIAGCGVPWTTECNLFCARCPAPVIAVTGSFGKSTTCAMLAHILTQVETKEARLKLDGTSTQDANAIEHPRIASRNWSGENLTLVSDSGMPYPGVEGEAAAFESLASHVYLGGNIGRSLLPELHRIRYDDIVVLEMSSAQLEDLPLISWRPAVAVITNIFPQHLDRHGTMEEYARAKLNLIGNPAQTKWVFAGLVDPSADSLLVQSAASHIRDERFVRLDCEPERIELGIPGTHNQVNAACALVVCRRLGLGDQAMRAALATFAGLPHRLQFIGAVDEVRYINDSKSTAPAAAVTALRSFCEPVVAIVGGQRKPVDLSELAALLRERCRAVVCMGESGATLAKAVDLSGEHAAAGRTPPVIVCDDLAGAVLQAKRLALPGDVILFSPGAPSFDHFSNYAARGEAFCNAVRAAATG